MDEDCSKKIAAINHSPTASLSAVIKSADPFEYEFKVMASDVDGDPLTYTWDFGEGTTRPGKAEEQFTYPAGNIFTVTVTVTDGISQPVKLSGPVNTTGCGC